MFLYAFMLSIKEIKAFLTSMRLNARVKGENVIARFSNHLSPILVIYCETNPKVH